MHTEMYKEQRRFWGIKKIPEASFLVTRKYKGIPCVGRAESLSWWESGVFLSGSDFACLYINCITRDGGGESNDE